MAVSDPWSRLRAGIGALGLAIDPSFAPRVRTYLDELERWSRIGRLTGYRSAADRIEHLILDSLVFLAAIPEPAAPLLDIGSGAGAPGLILKLARPEWPVTLVEANRRRANFLRHTLRATDLAAVTVRDERAEVLAQQPDLVGSFQTVTMRAVAQPQAAVGLARPFLRSAGHLVLSLGLVTPAVETGTIRRIEVADRRHGLRIRRRFLIIPATELAGVSAHVPRETGRVRGSGPGRREPEGRRRQDDHGGQSGRCPGSG